MEYTVIVQDHRGEEIGIFTIDREFAPFTLREFAALLESLSGILEEEAEGEMDSEEAQAAAEEERRDHLLAQQEMEDFAQDGDFENMSAEDIL